MFRLQYFREVAAEDTAVAETSPAAAKALAALENAKCVFVAKSSPQTSPIVAARKSVGRSRTIRDAVAKDGNPQVTPDFWKVLFVILVLCVNKSLFTLFICCRSEWRMFSSKLELS